MQMSVVCIVVEPVYLQVAEPEIVVVGVRSISYMLGFVGIDDVIMSGNGTNRAWAFTNANTEMSDSHRMNCSHRSHILVWILLS